MPLLRLTNQRVHSHYQRRLADLPWHGRVVEVQLQARRWRCINPECPRKIFTEKIARDGAAKSASHDPLCEHHLAIGFCRGRRTWLSLVAKTRHAGQRRHAPQDGTGGGVRADIGAARRRS
ncbi:hypothetical protein F2981_29415 (plasmid) [Sinorhizobium meliloti]|nr:hypothetical protein [Sinorhizobium meliloti]